MDYGLYIYNIDFNWILDIVYEHVIYTYEPRHDKTNIMGLRPAWF
jgi:hypothetical protein